MSRLQTRIDFRPGVGGVQDFTWESYRTQSQVQRALRYLDGLHPLTVPRRRPYRCQSTVKDYCRKKITCYALRRALILKFYRRLGHGRLRADVKMKGTWIMGTKKVCAELGIKENTGKSILRNYRLDGYYLRHPSEVTGQALSWQQRGRKLDPLREWLLEMLIPWRQLNLEQRVRRIQEEKDLVVSSTTLSKWYQANKIRYIRAKPRISNQYTVETKLRLQQEFALKLLHFIRQGYEIIYLDECSVTPWPKTGISYWQEKAKPIYLNIHPGGFFSVSVFGAISNKQPHFHWLINKGQNRHVMEEFLKHIHDWPLNPKKTVFVMDNAKV